MSSLSTLAISQTLKKKNIPLFTITSFQRLFNIQNTNTAYKAIQRLTNKNIIQPITHGKYMTTELKPSKFSIANFIYTPSYISLESALSHYGILPQFPFTITSITTKKTTTIQNQTTYQYSHISSKFYWGFQSHQSFIIASPEKALIDLIYFHSKGLKNLDIKELDLSLINKKIFKTYLKKINTPQFQNVIKKLNIC
ncbi:MAG: hypothetical protein ABII08_03000 [Candidatus Beckwithbacteria bacterium]